MARDINNSEDIIDSRDIIARIEELQAERDAAEEEASEGHAAFNFGADEREELDALQALAKQGEDYSSDWEYGSTLIRDSYFTQYAEQLADDIGAIDSNTSWPLIYIDWDAAADALKQDYTEIDFNGVTYWVR